MRSLRLMVLLLGASVLAATAQAQRPPEKAALAPELTGGLAWLNTDKPISLSALRGNVVLLDFWTAGCVNCMHMLSVLAQLEAKRVGQPLQVIGVHSAKFDSEKNPARVLAAVERYGIEHPVVVDRDMAIWERYGVEAWPTLVIIRADGRVAGAIPGEVGVAELDRIVDKVLDEDRADGTLASGPLLAHNRAPPQTNFLSFPGKVIASSDGRIVISDTGHHRVLVTNGAGRVQQVIGSGEAGQTDGPFATARMVEPQGLALDEVNGRLYIADARGQRVLMADLRQEVLSTIAGTGELGSEPLASTPSPARKVALRTPWDLVLRGNDLYLALAGSHQLAVIDLQSKTVRRLSGNGREALQDGSAEDSSFAQPSGLSLDGNTLYVADSEASAVRAVNVLDGSSRTLLGTGLFDWGDAVGPLRPKMLQHPIAVAISPGGLWIADTYNGKIKRLVASVPGKGFDVLLGVASRAAGETLDNPSGLSVETDGSLLIADTDRHRVLRLHPGTKDPVVVPVSMRAAPASVVSSGGTSMSQGKGDEIAVPERRVSTGTHALAFDLVAPTGYAFSEGAPWSIDLTVEGDAVRVAQRRYEGSAAPGKEVKLGTSLVANQGKATLLLGVRATICDDVNHAACYPRRLRFRVPISVTKAAEVGAEPLALNLTPPAVGTTGRR